jgi:hypothetical protein
VAQEYSYTHYGQAEGLASPMVYDICQDKDGFIWIGTETGVSRFDGVRFKNFTTKDGLPDLEVLKIFADSKGRIWMAPFRKSVCYYYQGHMYNQQTDSLLGRIHLKGNLEGFAEDAKGNILLKERNALHIITANRRLYDFDSLNHQPIRQCLGASRSLNGHFQAYFGEQIVEFSDTGYISSMPCFVKGKWNLGFIALQSWGIAWRDSINIHIRLFNSNRKPIQPKPINFRKYTFLTFSFPTDSLLYFNQSLGSIEHNLLTGKTVHYLPEIRVSKAFRDGSGDLWFTTLGKGLFRLNSYDLKTIQPSIKYNEKSAVTAITKVGNELWVGDNHESIVRYSLPDFRLIARQPVSVYFSSHRILFMDTQDPDHMLAGGDYGLIENTRDFRYIRSFPHCIKSATRIDRESLLIATHMEAGIFNCRSFRITDTLWRDRATVVLNHKDSFYIGTLDGLYQKIKGHSLVYLGDQIPFLKRRTSAMAATADGTIWIASYDAGIIAIKNNRQVAAIGKQQGLTSDICRTLLIHNNNLWVGTDKGLNKIALDKTGFPVTRITVRDGLVSDMINTLYASGSQIFVGTPDGLSFFDENKMMLPEECLLHLTSLRNANRERLADTTQLVIPYTDKWIHFEYAGISYRSAGDITYRYRMVGLDNTWRETKEHYLEYPDLPAGDYEWQIMAINKFGRSSRLLTLPIRVTEQWWKSSWFVVAVWLGTLALLWWLIYIRIKRVRSRLHEKAHLLQTMSELENTALKSQMNPHFIFNCLNSIQQFVFSGDIEESNKYIAGFSRLVRMTLSNSSRKFVTVRDEVDYLSSYLLLEKMRFKEKINYELSVDPALDQSAVLIPPMLIQPFVENSLLHGLMNKVNEPGFIHIHLFSAANRLKIVIEDNGIGRKAAAAKKKISVYPSQGMSLVDNRIRILSRLYKTETHVQVEDLEDEAGTAKGTRVSIDLPLLTEIDLYS